MPERVPHVKESGDLVRCEVARDLRIACEAAGGIVAGERVPLH
jgi:hypothetical protein